MRTGPKALLTTTVQDFGLKAYTQNLLVPNVTRRLPIRKGSMLNTKITNCYAQTVIDLCSNTPFSICYGTFAPWVRIEDSLWCVPHPGWMEIRSCKEYFWSFQDYVSPYRSTQYRKLQTVSYESEFFQCKNELQFLSYWCTPTNRRTGLSKMPYAHLMDCP